MNLSYRAGFNRYWVIWMRCWALFAANMLFSICAMHGSGDVSSRQEGSIEDWMAIAVSRCLIKGTDERLTFIAILTSPECYRRPSGEKGRAMSETR